MRMLCFLGVSIGVLGLGCAAGARGQDAPEKDRAAKEEFKRLEGTWRLVTGPDGRERDPAKDYDVFLIFAGNKCSLRHMIGDKETTREVEFTIDPTKSPKWVNSEGSDKRIWPGIYELKEDALKMVFQSQRDGERPTEFKEGNGRIMNTYKRVKP